MSLLGVNIDHIATLRQVRGTTYPDPVLAAKIAQDSGADQITCHLREDRRHIQEADLWALKESLSIPLNMEMAATSETLAIALKLKPHKVTLVPEKRQELTTEGGLDVHRLQGELRPLLQELQKNKIRISLFIDPEAKQVETSLELKIEEVEFHTGAYCEASDATLKKQEFQRLQKASRLADEQKLYVAAGHGLNYQNMTDLLSLREIQEWNIGHSIVAHAVIVGWERAVREMKYLISS